MIKYVNRNSYFDNYVSFYFISKRYVKLYRDFFQNLVFMHYFHLKFNYFILISLRILVSYVLGLVFFKSNTLLGNSEWIFLWTKVKYINIFLIYLFFIFHDLHKQFWCKYTCKSDTTSCELISIYYSYILLFLTNFC